MKINLTEEIKKFDTLVGAYKADCFMNSKSIESIDKMWNESSFWYVYKSKCRHYSLVLTIGQNIVFCHNRCGKKIIDTFKGAYKNGI
jgi:hypothetical protein